MYFIKKLKEKKMIDISPIIELLPQTIILPIVKNLQAYFSVILSIDWLGLFSFFFFYFLIAEDGVKFHVVLFAIFGCTIYLFWAIYYVSSLGYSATQSQLDSWGVFIVIYSILGVACYGVYLIISCFCNKILQFNRC